MNATESKVIRILGPDLRSTHWGVIIILAVRVNRFTDGDIAAAHWPTCACGKMYARKPYRSTILQSHMEPHDRELNRLASVFYNHVHDHDFECAAETMVEIEKRGSAVGSV